MSGDVCVSLPELGCGVQVCEVQEPQSHVLVAVLPLWTLACPQSGPAAPSVLLLNSDVRALLMDGWVWEEKKQGPDLGCSLCVQ